MLGSLILVLEYHLSEKWADLIPDPELLILEQWVNLLNPDGVPHKVPQSTVNLWLLFPHLFRVEELDKQHSRINGAIAVLPAR